MCDVLIFGIEDYSEILIPVYQSTRRHIPENNNLHVFKRFLPLYLLCLIHFVRRIDCENIICNLCIVYTYVFTCI